MAIVRVQGAVNSNTADAASIAVTLSGAATNNNTLIGTCGRREVSGNIGSITQPSGFSVARNTSPGTTTGNMTQISYKLVSGDGTGPFTFTNTVQNQEIAAAVVEWSGLKTSSVLGAVNSSYNSTAITGTTTSIAVTTTGTLSLLVFAMTHSDVNATPITSLAFSNSFTGDISIVVMADQNDVDHFTATKQVTSAASQACVATWATSSRISSQALVEFFGANDPPVNTVPVHTAGIYTTSDSATQISTAGPATAISVADTEGLTTCRVHCTSGNLTVTLSGSVVVSAGENGTSDLTLGSGASTAEFNTVLATLTYQGDVDFHGTDTINVVSTGTGGTDTDTFNVLNDPRSLTLTASAANFASMILAVASIEMRMDAGRQSATALVTATDDADLTDVQTITLQLAPVETVFPFQNLAVPTARRDRR